MSEVNTNLDENVQVKREGIANPQRNITDPRGFAMYRMEGNAYLNGSITEMADSLRAEIFAPEVEELAVISDEEFAKRPTSDKAPEEIVMPEEVEMPVEEAIEPKSKHKEYDKKRILPLVIILLVNILVLRIAIIGLFDAGTVGQYLSPFVKVSETGRTAVPLLDAFFAFFAKFNIDLGVSPVLQYEYNADVLSNIAYYATAIASAILAVLALVHIICALVALIGNKRDGYYKKVRFGLTAILSLVMVVIIYFGLLIINAEPLDVCALFVVDYIGLPLSYAAGSTLYAGYGLYILLLAPILTFICTCCAYRKVK